LVKQKLKADEEDLVDAGVEEALAENALAYHASCSEEDYVHLVVLGPRMHAGPRWRGVVVISHSDGA